MWTEHPSPCICCSLFLCGHTFILALAAASRGGCTPAVESNTFRSCRVGSRRFQQGVVGCGCAWSDWAGFKHSRCHCKLHGGERLCKGAWCTGCRPCARLASVRAGFRQGWTAAQGLTRHQALPLDARCREHLACGYSSLATRLLKGHNACPPASFTLI
jgi:hypothetical protein